MIALRNINLLVRVSRNANAPSVFAYVGKKKSSKRLKREGTVLFFNQPIY